MWIFPAVLLLLFLLDTCRSSWETSFPHFVFIRTCPDPPRLLFPRPPSLGLPHAGDHLELLSPSWECSASSKGAGRIPFPFSGISWMCPSMTHSIFQPLAPSLGMQSCHRSLSHKENLEFLPWTWSFWVFHAPLDAASPAGMAPTGMGTGLESVWGDF